MRGSADDAGDVAGGEAGGGLGWKIGLREFLSDHREAPVSFGEMLDAIGPQIPTFEIERYWHSARPNTKGLIAPNRKLEAIFICELRRYPLEVFGPPRVQGRAWTRDVKVRAIARPCPVCRTMFVAHAKVRSCSPAHGSELGKLTRNGESIMAASNARHPEIAALETVFETLIKLPLDARNRVIAHVAKLIEEEERSRQPGSLRIIEGRDGAAD